MLVPDPVVFDCETCASEQGARALEAAPPRHPARLKDPAKIDAWYEERTEKDKLYAAAEVDLARIVCLAWTTNGKALYGGTARNADEEAALLTRFWAETRGQLNRCTYVGFNINDFDLPLCIRRSQLLGVPHPVLDLGRYRHPGVVDLMQVLSWDGKLTPRKLKFYATLFGIPIKDKTSGADVPTLVAQGTDDAWMTIKRHCVADVRLEWALAERLGIVEAPQPVAPINLAEQAF